MLNKCLNIVSPHEIGQLVHKVKLDGRKAAYQLGEVHSSNIVKIFAKFRRHTFLPLPKLESVTKADTETAEARVLLNPESGLRQREALHLTPDSFSL